MDILEVIVPEQHHKLHGFELRQDEEGYVYRAQFSAARKNGKPARRYVELRIDKACGGIPPLNHQTLTGRWRWRGGYLHNNVAIFWDVAPDHRRFWDAFARYVRQCVHTDLQRKLTECQEMLFVLDAQ